MHAKFGGIVPEVASRQHLLTIIPTIEESLNQSKCDLGDLDLIAVTNGPGLAGSLLVGVNSAKGLAMAGGDIPLIGINHLSGHIYASWINENPDEFSEFPFLCLVASGGHTDLILMKEHREFELIARTRDDAAGEAFDKAARILGLKFPGGPEIEKFSKLNNKSFPKLPRPLIKGSLDFSFSGLKSSLIRPGATREISKWSSCSLVLVVGRVRSLIAFRTANFGTSKKSSSKESKNAPRRVVLKNGSRNKVSVLI